MSLPPPPPAGEEEYHLLITASITVLANAASVHQILLTGFTKDAAERAAATCRAHNTDGNVRFKREVVVIPTGRQIR